jgi:hypothetical protein
MSRQLRGFIDRLKNIENKSRNRTFTLFNIKKQEIRKRVKARLSEGLNTDGTPITQMADVKGERQGAYSKVHAKARLKRGKSKQNDHVDLNFKGSYYRKIKYTRLDDGFRIESDADEEKQERLEGFYGDKLLGLSENDLKELTDDVAQNLANFIAQTLTDI